MSVVGLTHGRHDESTAFTAEAWVPLLVLAALSAGYLVLAWRRRSEPRGWSGWRTVSLLVGAALLTVALVPGVLPNPPVDFRGHMQRHLIIGMVAPLFLVLSAPVTLLLRSLPSPHGKVVGRCLRSGPMHLLANPVTALVLSVGGPAGLYFTSLYAAMMDNAVVHNLVHVHFFVAGYLFAWVVAGPDPAPHRPSVPARLVVLGVAVALHAVMSQMLYAGILVRVPVSAAERQGAGELMYYGGDVAELLLAIALVTAWRPQRSSRSFTQSAAGDRRSPVTPGQRAVVGTTPLREHRKQAGATAPPARRPGEPDGRHRTRHLDGEPERSGKPDSPLQTHPGWFHRCRHTGELRWVPASAVPDSPQGAPAAHAQPHPARPASPGAGRSFPGG